MIIQVVFLPPQSLHMRKNNKKTNKSNRAHQSASQPHLSRQHNFHRMTYGFFDLDSTSFKIIQWDLSRSRGRPLLFCEAIAVYLFYLSIFFIFGYILFVCLFANICPLIESLYHACLNTEVSASECIVHG